MIEESVYLDLLSSRETKSSDTDVANKEEEGGLAEEVVGEVIEEEPTENIVEEPFVEEKEEVEEEEKVEDHLDNKAVQSLPFSYRQYGGRLLNNLTSSKDFTLGDAGEIYIHGKEVENYSIEKLLRTLCIPFHKGSVPMVLLAFLKELGLTKFRNHLVKPMPVWEKRYSWRESTMATRRGHVEDQNPSTRKRVKRATHT